MHEALCRCMGTLHKEKSNIDDDSGETFNREKRKKTMKSKAAGGCHYNTYKCLRHHISKRPFLIEAGSQRSAPL